MGGTGETGIRIFAAETLLSEVEPAGALIRPTDGRVLGFLVAWSQPEFGARATRGRWRALGDAAIQALRGAVRLRIPSQGTQRGTPAGMIDA